MGARGRKPNNVCALDLVVKERPKAPKWLPKKAKLIWKDIVESLPADHFRKSELPILEKYCMAQHIYREAMAQLGDAFVLDTNNGYKQRNPYLDIADKQFQLQMAAATKLRINTNARLSKEKTAYEKEEPPRKRKGLMFGGSE